MRLLKDTLAILFFALAEIFERLAYHCQDKGLPDQAKAEVTPNGHVNVIDDIKEPEWNFPSGSE